MGSGGGSRGDRRPPQTGGLRDVALAARHRGLPPTLAVAAPATNGALVNGRVLELTKDWQWSIEVVGGPEYIGGLLLRPAQIDRAARPRMRPGALVILEFVDDLWRVTEVSYLALDDLERVAPLVEITAEAPEGGDDLRRWLREQDEVLRRLGSLLGGGGAGRAANVIGVRLALVAEHE